MASVSDWQVPASVRPKQEDYGYDLDRALMAVVGVHTKIPEDAFTADTLGTERMGHGVLIRDRGVVLTIGYLVTEARRGLAQPGRRPAGAGPRARLRSGDRLRAGAGAGAARPAVACARPLERYPRRRSGRGRRRRRTQALGRGAHRAKQEFAGYWEYVLDEAIFTTPAHPNWGGTALIGSAGDLLGIGSLQMQQAPERGQPRRRSQHDRADRSVEADPRRHAQDRPGQPRRRGPGSVFTRPRSRTRSSSWAWRAVDRPRRRA